MFDVWRRALLLLAVLASPLQLLSQKMTLEYDKGTDFAKFKTYGWVKGFAVADPMMDLHIIGTVDYDLKAKGLTKVEAPTADLLVTYHAAVNTDMNISGFYMPAHYSGIPAPGYTIWYVPSTMSSVARYIKKGSLVVEMADRQTQQLVWAAVATGTVKEKKQDKLKQLDRVVGRMFDQYPPSKK